jgi:nitroreductase
MGDPTHLTFGVDRAQPPLPVWNRKGPLPREVMDFILAAGVQAPSGENLQPWAWRQQGDQIDLLLNARADPSFFNFRQRATLIANGALLENMAVAASLFGLETTVREEPAGDGDERVASLRFTPGARRIDPLADAIWKRETNRRLYDKRPLPRDKQHAFELAANDRGACLHLITEQAGIDALAEAVYWADRVRLALRECHEPFHHALRKNATEARARGDGFSFNNLLAGIDGRIFLTLTRPWKLMQWANRIGISNKVASIGRNGVASASAVGLLTMPGDSPRDYLRGGRALEHLWLTATAHGWAIQPMASVVFFWTVWRAEGDAPFPLHARHHLRRARDLLRPCFPEVNFDRQGLVILVRMGTATPMPEGTFRKPLNDFLPG